MKEVRIAKDITTTIDDVAIPEPQPDQVIIQVVVSGSNPKDWKIFNLVPDLNTNTGDDIAGIVHSVGSNVWEFKKGDRVASFHEMGAPGGSFAEYAIGLQHTTFHIPMNVSFEEAATIPLAAMTAALGIYQHLKLPYPWAPAKESTPLVVYGGAAAVGAFAIKFARLANIHPIIAVAGRGQQFVERLIDRSKGDTVVDYRDGNEAIVQRLKAALKGQKLWYAFDATVDHGSYTNILQVLEPTGYLTTVNPFEEYKDVPATVKLTKVNVGASHGAYGLDEKDFTYIMLRYIGRSLAEGLFKPHPYQVVPGGLEGVETGLKNLRDGKASGFKYVFKIRETPNVKTAY
jgi:NADPH:quinone reductase-like Zn-dependent oxidoreductase